MIGAGKRKTLRLIKKKKYKHKKATMKIKTKKNNKLKKLKKVGKKKKNQRKNKCNGSCGSCSHGKYKDRSSQDIFSSFL